jgi:hypothetical protein
MAKEHAARTRYLQLRADVRSYMAKSDIYKRQFGTAKQEITVLADIDANKPGVHEQGIGRIGLIALLNSAIVGALTAFESCATDIWTIAVNARPQTLAWNVVMLPPTGAKKADRHDSMSQQTFTAKGQEPKFDFSSLAEHGFDVSRNMGDVLRESKRVTFNSIAAIRCAYFDAFRSVCEDKKYRIDNRILDIFDHSFPDLQCLDSLRNLIAHRGGVVDDRFRREVEECSPEMFNLASNRPFPITGEMVSRYLACVTSASTSLLNFVAEWLANHSR